MIYLFAIIHLNVSLPPSFFQTITCELHDHFPTTIAIKNYHLLVAHHQVKPNSILTNHLIPLTKYVLANQV